MHLGELQPVLGICPAPVRTALQALPAEELNGLEEIRLRIGRQAGAVCGGKERNLLLDGKSLEVSGEMLRILLARCTAFSTYAAEAALAQGYVTLPGGHRVGFCGKIVPRPAGGVKTLRNISSASIRVAKDIDLEQELLDCGILDSNGSTLVLGEPGSGKTTFLRAFARLLSDRGGQRVCIVDERQEIAGWDGEAPVFPVGTYTDVLSGCPKAEGITMALRSMAPHWIFVDEITAAEDIRAMEQASYCGVRFAASVHAAGAAELSSRPLYQNILKTCLFQRIVTLNAERKPTVSRLA